MTSAAPAPPAPRLPGELIMWVLIFSELAVFGAGLLAFLAVRLGDPAGFAEAQAHVHRLAAAANTVVLLTSGWLAARAHRAAEAGRTRAVRANLGGAAALGAVFLAIKAAEYADVAGRGFGPDSHPFFTFYWGLTGFHAAHVAAGIIILGLVALRGRAEPVEAATQFWHMVDLVWVLLVPIVYLLPAAGPA